MIDANTMKKTIHKSTSVIPLERVQNSILLIRSKRVMLDSDLAHIYGVPTKRLNEQVRRNLQRFPQDFMFRLTVAEKAYVVANRDHLQKLKFSSTLPYAFTEHGAFQLASVLNSPTAVEVSILIVRAFVQLSEVLASHTKIAHKLEELEHKIASHDETITSIIEAIRQLMEPPEPPKRRPIGFRPPGSDE